MRLVVATPLYPPESGGPATYAKLLEEGLPSRGIEPVVVKFSAVRSWPRVVRHFMYERLVARALRGADAVLALDPVSTGLPSMRAAKKTGKPFFVKIVGDYAWEQGTQRFGVSDSLDEFVKRSDVPFPVQLLRRVQKGVANAASAVIVPSEYLKGIVATWGIPREKISVIHNGITLQENILAGQKRGAFVVASAGRRVPWKGFEAIERVSKAHGWDADIITGVPHEEALARIKAADVFVLNSTYEGLSHLLIEAMMLGTPVIATNVGGNPELITDGQTGLLIPVRNDDALARALEEVAHNADAAHVRAKAAQERMKSFTASAMLDATAAVLKNAL